jgi:CheY-like chemotaxis protein
MSKAKVPFVILLAEDEPADAHLVEAAFVENKIATDLRWVLDGREAMEFLLRKGTRFANAPRPDIILLDLNMPRMDGRECLAQIKLDKNLCDIPVVILTTSNVQRDVLASYKLGAAGYIAKPLDIKDFFEVVRKFSDYWMSSVKLPQQM